MADQSKLTPEETGPLRPWIFTLDNTAVSAREKTETAALCEVGAEETYPEEAVVRSTEAFPPADVELPEGAGARFPVVVSIRSASSL